MFLVTNENMGLCLYMLISDQYCHDRSDNYIILPRYVVRRNSEGVLLASALKSRLKEFLQHLQMVLLLFSLALFFQSVKGWPHHHFTPWVQLTLKVETIKKFLFGALNIIIKHHSYRSLKEPVLLYNFNAKEKIIFRFSWGQSRNFLLYLQID